MPADDPPDREAGTSEADQGSHFEPQGSKDRWHYGGGGFFFVPLPCGPGGHAPAGPAWSRPYGPRVARAASRKRPLSF